MCALVTALWEIKLFNIQTMISKEEFLGKIRNYCVSSEKLTVTSISFPVFEDWKEEILREIYFSVTTEEQRQYVQEYYATPKNPSMKGKKPKNKIVADILHKRDQYFYSLKKKLFPESIKKRKFPDRESIDEVLEVNTDDDDDDDDDDEEEEEEEEEEGKEKEKKGEGNEKETERRGEGKGADVIDATACVVDEDVEDSKKDNVEETVLPPANEANRQSSSKKKNKKRKKSEIVAKGKSGSKKKKREKSKITADEQRSNITPSGEKGVLCDNISQLQTNMKQKGFCCLRMSPEFERQFLALTEAGDDDLLLPLVQERATDMNKELQPKHDGEVLRYVRYIL